MVQMTHMRISAIAIIAKNRGLGKDNKLLFHIPGELPRFKKITTGHSIIMGRKTFESIGRVLPGRTNIIITRDASYLVDGAVVVSSLKEAIQKANEEEEKRLQNVILSETKDLKDSSAAPQNDKEGEIFIIGGGQIFKEALPLITRLYLTVVDKEVDADTFFPDYAAFDNVIEKEEHLGEEIPYTFLTLERNS